MAAEPKPVKEPFGEFFIPVSKLRRYQKDPRQREDAIRFLARYQDDDEYRKIVEWLFTNEYSGR